MPFFTYNQNNSGGGFEVNEERGISHYVIIEADDADAADARAEKIGLYFDGAADGPDCPCCGDRWYRAWSGEGSDVPSIYGTPLHDIEFTTEWRDEPNVLEKWIFWAPEVYVHFADGRIQAYGLPRKSI